MTKKLEHILCVDDDPHLLRLVQICLQTVGGFRISTATNGTEAIAAALNEKPDMILLDVMMPDMDGPATLAKLRSDPQTNTIPVVFMTARIRESEIQEYLALGANGVVSKPFDPMTISTEIETIWKRAHG